MLEDCHQSVHIADSIYRNKKEMTLSADPLLVQTLHVTQVLLTLLTGYLCMSEQRKCTDCKIY